MSVNVFVHPSADGDGYDAWIGVAELFRFTDFGEFNNRLRNLETQGDLVVNEAQTAGYETCDQNECRYAATLMIIWKKPDRWIVQVACGEHSPVFIEHAAAHGYPHQEMPFDPEAGNRPEWGARFQLDAGRADAPRILRAIILPHLPDGRIVGPDEGWSLKTKLFPEPK